MASMRRYDAAASAPPIATTRSHASVNGASRSGSDAIATVAMPRRLAVAAMRATISPRLAMRSGPTIGRSAPRGRRVHVLGDDAEHHLVGAAGDRAEAAVAVVARDRVVPRVAHAAPVLHARVGNEPAEPARLELGHRRPLGDVLAGDVLLGRHVDQATQR